MTKRAIILIFLIVFIITGCAGKNMEKATPFSPHSHYYPFTEVLEDYHVRLVVDHTEGVMILVFEDISERPIKAVRLQRIKGNAILPDGKVIKETFRAKKPLGTSGRPRGSKFYFGRSVGKFNNQAEWVKTTPKFDLKVTFPFRGTDRELAFNYEVYGGKIPSHKKL